MIGKKNSAFTMVEILIVLVIIGALFAFVGPRLIRMFGKSDKAVTQLRMNGLKDALLQYKTDVGHYPTKKDGGLRALIESPGGAAAEKWDGPYVASEEDLEDKWGRDFEYNIPPVKEKKFRYFEIISFGADGEEGGKGDNAEIHVGG